MGASKRSGVLVLDKPEGISSAKVVAIVKKALGAGKAGHAGTLDPLATGVLVCCVNDATRLARFLMQGQKAYEAVLRLGQQTDSLDATGHVLETAPDAAVAQITATQIDAVARRFVGRIEQQPPVYSALKHKGTPLYRLARKGHPVQKPPRAVHIDDVQILSVDLPRVRFAVTCSPGTYIRTLAADMGAALGCGGHLEALRRTASSGFTLADALPLSAIAPAVERVSETVADHWIDMPAALKGMPEIRASGAMLNKIAHGQRLTEHEVNGSAGDGPYVKVIGISGELVAVLEHNPGRGYYGYCCVFTSSQH
jgi:tRNA pseudouridine55 synthase